MIICVIPAKSDSRRLKGKNMAKVAGRPLIYYTIKTAQQSRKIDKIYLSTDSEEIAGYAEKMGVQVIRRGPELCGEAPLLEVFHHAYESVYNSEVTHIVGLQPDHPDRRIDIDETIQYGLDSGLDLLKSVDGKGRVNGSFWMIKAPFLREKHRDFKVGTIMDPCTNIHTEEDLLVAERYILAKTND